MLLKQVCVCVSWNLENLECELQPFKHLFGCEGPSIYVHFFCSMLGFLKDNTQILPKRVVRKKPQTEI